MAGARPSSYKKGGGGFLNGVDGAIADYEFTDVFPGGDSPRKKKDSDFRSLWAILSARPDGAEDDVTTTLFVGGADDFEIEDDGHTLVPTDDSVSLRQNTGWGIFMQSLVDAGFPEELLPEDAINFEPILNTRVRFGQRVNEEVTKKYGKRKAKKGKGEYDRTDLVIEKVYALPDEKKAGKAAKAGKPAAAPAKSAKAAPASKSAANGKATDLDQLSIETLLTILTDQGEPLAKPKLGVKILKQMGKHPQRQDVYKMLFDEDFLAREEGWTYDAAEQMLALAE